MEGVHDTKDVQRYLAKASALQRNDRVKWLLTEFGYGSRDNAKVLDTTKFAEGTQYSGLLDVPENPDAVVVDLGCGPGNSTQVVLETLPAKTVIGVDPSQGFLVNAAQTLQGYTSLGRLSLKLGTAERLHDVVDPNTADLVFASVVWQYFTNRRQALDSIGKVLKPGAKFVTFVSSTHYDFEMKDMLESDGPITYDGTIGRNFISTLEDLFEAELVYRPNCVPKESQQFNSLPIMLELARQSGLGLVKYEERNWPYEKNVLETKLRAEPPRIMANDPVIKTALASGRLTPVVFQSLVDKAVDITLASPEYANHKGRFSERWACFALQKPYDSK